MARSSSRPTAGPAASATSTSTTITDDSKDDSGGGLGPLFFVGVGLLFSVVGFVALLARDMDMFKPLPPRGFHPPGFTCRVLGKGFVGVEDFVLVSGPAGQVSSSSAALPRVLLAGSDDRLRLWEHPQFGPGKTPDGVLLALYDHGGEDIRMEPLPLAGFPKDVAFHPHGLYFHKESQKLYVVNHAYAKGGERIDVFKVALGKKDGKASVTWKYAIAPLLFQAEAMGTLNDLVVVDGRVDGQDELYVTHYRPFPDSIEGRLAPGSVLAKAHNRLTDLSMAIKGRWTRVLYCKGGTCRPTEVTAGIGPGQNGLAFNGINLSPDKRRLLVADTKFVHVFEILPPLDNDKIGGSRHRLKRIQLLQAPHLVDNIEAVEAANEGEEAFTLGSVGHIFQFLQHNQIYAQQESGDRDPSKLNITGGVQLLTRHKGTGRYDIKEVFLADGSALSGVSAAVRLPPLSCPDGGSPPERFLLGSWSDTGVLLCTRTRRGGAQQQDQEL